MLHAVFLFVTVSVQPRPVMSTFNHFVPFPRYFVYFSYRLFRASISDPRINAFSASFCFLRLKPTLYSRKQGRQTVDLKKKRSARKRDAGNQPTRSHCNAYIRIPVDRRLGVLRLTVSKLLIDMTCKDAQLIIAFHAAS